MEAGEPRTLHTEVLSDHGAFERLRAEWDDLLEASGQCVYFLRYSWNVLWWSTYAGQGSELFLVTCRDDSGKLTGLAPFYRRQLRTFGIPHVREVLFVGTGVFTQTSQFPDIMALRGWEQPVAEAVAALLAERADWDRLWLTSVPSASTILPFFKASLGGEVCADVADCSHVVDTSLSWDTLLASLGRSTRRNTLKGIRKIGETFAMEFRCVTSEGELDCALDALVRLHQLRWKSIGEPGSFALPHFERFLRAAARDSLAQGSLRLWTLSLDGEIAAAKLAFVEMGTAYGFQQGFDPAHLKYALGRVMSSLCLKACTEDPNVDRFDFMGGDYQYKDSWSKAGTETVTLSLLRRGPRVRIFMSIENAKARVRSLTRALVPRSIKVAARRALNRREYSRS